MADRKKQNPAVNFDEFTRKLSAIEEEIYQVQNRSGQDPLNFPIKLNNKLAALERVIETGDGKPIAGAEVVFKELSDQFAAQKAKFDAIIKTDLPAINQTLPKPLEVPTSAPQ